MEEQLISFETAKLVKEKGFDVRVIPFYNGLQDKQLVISEIIGFANQLSDWYPAPTQSLLQKWLREKHGIHIVLIPTINSAWTYKTTTVLSERDDEVIIGIKDVGDLPPYKNVCGEDFSTYEKALEAGLQEALKLIP